MRNIAFILASASILLAASSIVANVRNPETARKTIQYSVPHTFNPSYGGSS
ncbi:MULTISPECIES: hypothetical protein [Falsihalocynthiibacter]|uniref:hypothetical protein n=1 Tax=Falsihalocynthiibacter TaxID=2854182 RepID=UPI003001973B